MRTPISVLTALVLLLPLGPARAAELLPKAEVDRLVKPYVDGEYVNSLAIALVTKDGVQTLGYGHVSGADSPAPEADTVYEIGSITKAFTGILLADMVLRGEVKLDDPVQQHLPDALKVPTTDGAVITIESIATHRSGLPRMPSNFEPEDAGNPFADYTVERMAEFLRGHTLARKPGDAYEYSNLAFGLLGQTMAHVTGKPYEQLMIERLAKPLGMTDTTITFSDAQRKRVAPGFDADGNPQKNWDIPTMAAGGAIRSTARDMGKFLQANLGQIEVSEQLRHAMAMSRQKRAEGGDPHNDMGLGWHINKSLGITWHNGQTGGYHSYAGFVVAEGVGVVVLSNTGTGVVDDVGVRLVQRLRGKPVDPPAPRLAAKIDPALLDAYVGVYMMNPLFQLTVTREGEQLFVQATGQPKFRVFPESDRKFFWKVVDAQATFDEPVEGKSPRLVLHQNGLDQPATRVPQ